MRTSENSVTAKFAFWAFSEVDIPALCVAPSLCGRNSYVEITGSWPCLHKTLSRAGRWNRANFAITEFSEVRLTRPESLLPTTFADKVALGLTGFPCRLYPRPHDFAVLGDPMPRPHQRGVLLVDLQLQGVDLLLGELQRVHEGTGFGVFLAQIPPHDCRALGRIVRRPLGVLGVLQVPDVVPLIHPVRRSGQEDEVLPEGVQVPDLGEHACGGCLYELLLEAVSRNDLSTNLIVHHRARLDAQDELRVGAVKLIDALDVHVGRDRQALLSLPQKPRVEALYLFGDLIEQGLLVGQPHVLEGVHLAARYPLVRRIEVLVRVDINPLVTELVLEKDLRQVGDRHVLVPTYVGQHEPAVLPEAAAARQGEGTHHEREDRRHNFADRLRRRSFQQLTCSS